MHEGSLDIGSFELASSAASVNCDVTGNLHALPALDGTTNRLACTRSATTIGKATTSVKYKLRTVFNTSKT